MLPWTAQGGGQVMGGGRSFWPPVLAGAVVAAACALAGIHEPYPVATFGLAGFVVYATAREFCVPVRNQMRADDRSSVFGAALHVASAGRRKFGGYIVHMGVVAMVVAIAASSAYKTFAQATLTPGESLSLGEYQVTLNRVVTQSEPHRHVTRAMVTVTSARSDESWEMWPGINQYDASRDPIGTPHVRGGFLSDLYLTLVAYEPDGSSATLKGWVFPMVGWIWWSAPLLVLGALISLFPRRARVPRTVPLAAPEECRP